MVLEQKIRKQRNKVYLISFGQSYHDIYDVIDYDFGIDFAEKTIARDDITHKHVNFFQQNKLAEVTNFRRSSLGFDKPTESFNAISGIPFDKTRYGSTIKCSLGVTFNIKTTINDFKNEIIDYIINIDEILEEGPTISTFPRLRKVQDKELEYTLDNHLLTLLKTAITENNVVDLSRFIETPNSLIVLEDMTNLTMYIIGNKKESNKIIFDGNETIIDQLINFCEKNKEIIFDINKVKVEMTFPTGETQQYSIKKVLHAEINIQEKKYLLHNGKWGVCNNEYHDLINEFLENNIEVKFNSLSGRELVFKNGEEGFIENFCSENKDEYIELHKKFIKPHNKNYIVRGKGIELADIYNSSTDELFAVKRGISAGLSLYSLEQSILGINAIKNSSAYDMSKIEETIGTSKINNLKSSVRYGVIWMLPLKMSNYQPVANIFHTNNVLISEFKLKDLGSVLIKNKLVEWAQFAMDNRFKPTIYMETPVDTSQ